MWARGADSCPNICISLCSRALLSWLLLRGGCRQPHALEQLCLPPQRTLPSRPLMPAGDPVPRALPHGEDEKQPR